MAASLIVPGIAPQAGEAQAAETSQVCSRAGVLAARDAGGPQVREAAEAALLGGEEEVCAFVHDQWSMLELVDREIYATQMFASGGPTMRETLTPLLDAEDPDALGSFLTDGWRDPWLADQEIRINQLASMGGPQVKTAARAALDAGTPEALEEFLHHGLATAQEVDVELRVNQALAAGGPRVKEAAAAALDTGRHEALVRFLDIEWGVAAARDHEQASVTDLLHAAEDAGNQAEAAMNAATDEADLAEEAAALAKEAAETARSEAQAAGSDRRRAEIAAGKAAQAARSAASAAGTAVGAANDAAAAARTAANAAVRVAMAASLAERKAAEASRAAADARSDRDAAANARQKASEARAAAQAADKAETAIQEALNALAQVQGAIAATESAVGHANGAAAAAQEAADAAVAAGADAATAYAAAERARAAAIRAQRAAAEAVAFARYAREQAIVARDAARSAVAHARNAAAAAEDAAEHAGEAVDAAVRAREDAEAASEAAAAARHAAQQAQEIYAEARRQDRLRLAREREQLVESAREAARIVQEVEQAGGPTLNTPRTQQRPPAVQAALDVATDPDTPRETAIARAREAALGLVDSGGSWTRDAARAALVGHDEQVLAFARGGLRSAEGMDDRTTLVGLVTTGTEAMRGAAEVVMRDGTDAEVATFLENPDYPERREEDELETTRVLAAAREAGDAHTVDAATVALDDGSATVLRAFLETGQYAAREADNEIKVNQIFQDAPEGSELRINAEVALEGPPAFRKRFLQVGRHDAAARDRRTAAHVETMSSLVLQVAEVAARATENEKRAWEEAARAAGAAQDAANYAEEAATAAAEAGRHAEAANDAAARASESAADAKRSADTAQDAAAEARGSAEAAARSATWAAVSHGRAIEYAQDATDSAAQAWHDAIAAGDSATAAALDSQAAYEAAYELMVDEVLDDAEYQIHLPPHAGGCLGGDKEYYEQCASDIWDQAVKLIEADFDPTVMVYINSDLCTSVFGDDQLAERCLSNADNLNFLNAVKLDLDLDSLWTSMHILEPWTLFLLDLELRFLPKGLCGKTKACRKVIKKITGGASDEWLPDIYSQEYWDSWNAAWKEYWTSPSLQELSRENARLLAMYHSNACLNGGSGGTSPHQCVEQRIHDALDDLSWSPPSFDVGGQTVRMPTDLMVRVMSHQTWEYFGVLPTNVRRYFAPTDTVADLDRYLAEVVRHNEAGIREYLEGNSVISEFSHEIDGYIYTISVRRDGSITQFFRQ